MVEFFNMIIQWFLSLIPSFQSGTLGGNTQNPKPSEVAGVPASGAQSAVTAGQTTTQHAAPTQPEQPKPSAETVMADWKQAMAANNIPQSVQLAIAVKEPQLVEQLRTAQTPEQMQAIQMAAYTEATKPEWDKFEKKAHKNIDDTFNKMANGIKSSVLSEDEKQKAFENIQAQKEKYIEKTLGQFDSDEKKIRFILTPKEQERFFKETGKELENANKQQATNLDNASKAKGWGSGSFWLGMASLGLTVAGVAVTATGVGSPVGIALIAGGASLTGVGSAYCGYQKADLEGSTLGKGWEIANGVLCAIPVVGTAASKGMQAIGLAAKGIDLTTDTIRAASAVKGLSLGDDGFKIMGEAISIGKGLKFSAVDEVNSVVNTFSSSLKNCDPKFTSMLKESLETVAGAGRKSLQNQAAKTVGHFDIASEAKELAKLTGLSGQELLEAEKLLGQSLVKAASSNGNNIGVAAKYLAQAESGYTPEIGKKLIEAGNKDFWSGKGAGLTLKQYGTIGMASADELFNLVPSQTVETKKESEQSQKL